MVAISDALRASAERVAAEIGVATIYDGRAGADRDRDVDAVVIASPAITHEPFTLACLDAGKPVLCEKPLAIDAEASLRVVEAEAALGRRLVHVGFMRRYDPGYVDLKARLDAGAVGAPLLVHCAHRNPSVHAFFDIGMIITDTVVHEIDITRWLLGQEIVRAHVLTPRAVELAPEGLRDPQLVIFETEGGRLVDVEAFVNAGYGYDIRCEVVGEAGTLELRRRRRSVALGRPAAATRSRPTSSSASATPTCTSCRAGSRGEPAGATRVGRLRRRRGLRGRRRVARDRPAGRRPAPHPRPRSPLKEEREAMPNIGPMELVIVAVIALLVLGPKRLPDAGRSLGRGLREFKQAIGGKDEPKLDA